jgi:hypothetical protein
MGDQDENDVEDTSNRAKSRGGIASLGKEGLE